jgi:hypothetical protein
VSWEHLHSIGKGVLNTAMQSSARIGGAIVVAIGLLLFAWAFLWMKYSVRMQIRGQAIIRRIIGRPVVEDEWYFGFFGAVRWFGTMFIALMGLLCVTFGLVGLISGG